MPNSLDGLRLLVTRPVDQAAPLVESLRQAGARPRLLPMLDIRPWQSDDLLPRLRQLADYDLAVFVSRNAVIFTQRLLDAHGLAFPATLPVATVGKGTAGEIRTRLGRPADLVPEQGADSEALLARSELADMTGKRVLLFRGRGGRETLADTLRQRGARVDLAEVYQRVRPEVDAATVADALDDSQLILITSSEALDNLLALTPEHQRAGLLAKPLLVIHPRQAVHARQRGFTRPALLAAGGSSTSILQALQTFVPPASST